MSIDYSNVTGLSDHIGNIVKITDASGRVLWSVPSGDKIILEVAQVTTDTYFDGGTYSGQHFILLDIYPKPYGTVYVTYGGLTKTITDTSGAAEPNALGVYFGWYGGGVDDGTPDSGTLTIEGDYYAFGCGTYPQSKVMTSTCLCVTSIKNWGTIEHIIDNAFSSLIAGGGGVTGKLVLSSKIKSIGASAFAYSHISGDLVIPSSVETIGQSAFSSCCYLATVTFKGRPVINPGAFSKFGVVGEIDALSKVILLSEIPPTLVPDDAGTYSSFGAVGSDGVILPEQIVVPKGCGDIYKTAEGWSVYADLIVEAE